MGKVALVTGGSRGIGAAISRALKEAGYEVAANYAGNDDAAKAFTDETGIKTYKWSVADYDACAAGIKQVEEELGPIAVLVNNAGITRDAMFHKMTPEQWKEVMDTNLTGVFLCSQAAGRVMLTQGSGSIINIASVAGLRGTPSHFPVIGYSASKGGVITFTRDLAWKWGPRGIRVNAIAPGWFPSDMSRVLLERYEKEFLAAIPLGRFGGEQDLKGAAIFLAARASAYMTGQVLVVDGGQTA